MVLASQLADTGQADTAIEQVKALLKGNADDREVYVALSQMYTRLKRWNEAEQAISKAEQLSTKPEDKTLLDAALLPSTTVEFFRVKNSWGSARPDRAFAPGMPGYHDLHLDYLDGPRFPADFNPTVAEVIGRPGVAFTQAILIAAGSDNGVRLNDPVVTAVAVTLTTTSLGEPWPEPSEPHSCRPTGPGPRTR